MYATANIYERVVRITSQDGSTGTGTVIEHGGKTYVVTARHVLPMNPNEPITFGNRFRSSNGPATPLPGVNPDADVAIFQVPDDWAMPHLPIDLTSDGLIFSQDVLFLGFPYAHSFRIGGDDGVPFVKKATLSAIDHRPTDRLSRFSLDGINNPGFSGGPVVVADFQNPPKFFAVVHGYQPEWLELHIGGAPVPDAVLASNTGIMFAYDIKHALEALP